LRRKNRWTSSLGALGFSEKGYAGRVRSDPLPTGLLHSLSDVSRSGSIAVSRLPPQLGFDSGSSQGYVGTTYEAECSRRGQLGMSQT
jgi:hypothetical protein